MSVPAPSTRRRRENVDPTGRGRQRAVHAVGDRVVNHPDKIPRSRYEQIDHKPQYARHDLLQPMHDHGHGALGRTFPEAQKRFADKARDRERAHERENDAEHQPHHNHTHRLTKDPTNVVHDILRLFGV